jgi:hypothetical protein
MNKPRILIATLAAGIALAASPAFADGRYDTHSHGNRDGNVALAIVGGLVLGAALNQASQSNYYEPPAAAYYPPAPTYYPPARTYYPPAPTYYAPVETNTVCYANGRCVTQTTPSNYYQPAPTYYAPAPTYYTPAPTYYTPAPIYYTPPAYYPPSGISIGIGYNNGYGRPHHRDYDRRWR